MNLLARLIISIETFFKNPGKWVKNHGSLFLALFLVLSTPLISLLTISIYHNTYLTNTNQDNYLANSSSQTFSEQLAEYQQTQAEQTEKISELKNEIIRLQDLLASSEVLGITDQVIVESELSPAEIEVDKITESLKERLERTASTVNSEEDHDNNDPDSTTENLKNNSSFDPTTLDPEKSVFVLPASQGTKFYTEPSKKSAEKTNLETESLYEVIMEYEDWYKLDTRDGSYAWVQKKYTST